jgi:hypothetical protein
MKKISPLVLVSAAALVGAGIAACTSFSSGPDNGTGGMTGGGTGGSDTGSGGSTTGTGGVPDTGAGGSTTGAGGSTTAAGGSTGATGGKTGAGGSATGAGGATAGMGGATGAGGAVASQTVCDILSAAGNPCVVAHSTTRLLNSKYTGPLYQVCKGASVAGPNSCPGAVVKDIGTVAGGFADSATQDTFCAGSTCTFSIIYDQSGNNSFLKPSPRGGNGPANNPAVANALKLNVSGHPVYGVYIRRGQGYRAGCTGCGVTKAVGTAVLDEPETEYMLSSQTGLVDGCCFDYGNAETDSNDDGNGTMEAVYFGGGVVWDSGAEGGHSDATNPWVMGDLENGLFAGFSTTRPSNAQTIAGNTALHFKYVTAVLVGDVASQNNGAGRFAIYGGDSTSGVLKVMYDGIRPSLGGYVPMKKQGSIILGTGGDNSNQSEGQWFEGVMATGAATAATINSVQLNIVNAKYGQ